MTLSPNAVPSGRETVEADATIVGRAIFNDTFSAEAGDGALLPAGWLRQLDPTIYAEQFVVRLAPEVSIDDVRADYARVIAPTIQTGLASLRRIAIVPWLLAAAVAALAGGVMALTLVTSVRRSRRQLAILRALGLTGRQVRSAVAWQATALATVAVVVGVPLGYAVGRWVWRALAAATGIATPPAAPVIVVVLGVAALLAIANLVALAPARAAARTPAVDALRAE